MVSITSILAVVGVALFIRSVSAAKGGEAISVIGGLRSAEEAYQAENHQYLNVSTANGGKAWYPSDGSLASSKRYGFGFTNSGHVDAVRWRALAPVVNSQVLFGYLVNAGGPLTSVPPLQLTQNPTFPSPMPLDWYVIQAQADVDGDTVFARYAACSLNSEVVVEKEGE